MSTTSIKEKSRYLYRLFKLPTTETLLNDFSCAIVKSILIHGRLYISNNYMCFYSNLFGVITEIVVKLNEIKSIQPKNTVGIIPNAILFTTMSNEIYEFASFFSREEVLILLSTLVNNDIIEDFIPTSNINSAATSNVNSAATSNANSLQNTPRANFSSISNISTLTIPSFDSSASLPPGNLSSRGNSEDKSQIIIKSSKDLSIKKSNRNYEPYFELTPKLPYYNPCMEICEKDYGLICEEDLNNLTPLAIFKYCYSQAAIYSLYEAKELTGDSETFVSAWQKRDLDNLMIRSTTFRSPIKGAPIGPPSTRMNMATYLQWMSEDGLLTSPIYTDDCSVLHVIDALSALDAPYCDYFNISDHYKFQLISLDPPVTKLRVTYALRFVKPTWFQSLIASKSRSGFADACAIWLNGLKESVIKNSDYVSQLLLNKEIDIFESKSTTRINLDSDAMDWPGSVNPAASSDSQYKAATYSAYNESTHSYKYNPLMQAQLDRNIFFTSVIEICTLVFEFCIDPKRSFILLIIGILFFISKSVPTVDQTIIPALFSIPTMIYNSIYNPTKICSGISCSNRALVDSNLENVRESMKFIKSILAKNNDEEIKISASKFQEELRVYRRELIELTEK